MSDQAIDTNTGWSLPALRQRGLGYLRQGDIPAAVALLQQAHALAQDDPWGQMHLGLGLQAAGRHAEAVALFRASQNSLVDDPAPLLNLTASLLSLGDTTGAVQAASDACHLAPGRAETHYTYGLALLAAAQPAWAGQAFATAVRLAPNFVDAWVNLGLARYRLADMDGARLATATALRLAPLHRAATGNLAVFLRLTGDGAASEALLRQLLEHDPTAAEARLNLAASLLNEERPGEALAVLQVGLPTDPRIRCHWQLQHALALLQTGQTGQARRVLATIGAVPAALQPQLLWRQVLLALADGQPANAETIATQMEAAITASGQAALPEHRIMAHYDLAKFWSRQSNHDRAIAHWQNGHTLLAAFQPFSRPAHRAIIDATIDAFSHQRLHTGARASNRDPAPVFICGMPRSGTTLIEQILAAHAQAHGAGERGALAETVSRLGGGSLGVSALHQVASLDAAALDQAAEAYLAALHALAPDADRIVDKMPANYLHLGLVGLMLPGARIIQCWRDPRDIGLSIFTFRFHGHHAYAHDLGDLGWYIGEHDRLWAHWRRVLPNPILQVRLQDWVEDFPGTLARVLQFLDLPDDPACVQFHTQQTRVATVSRKQVRQPINASGLGRWHAYAHHLVPLINELEQAGSLPGTADAPPPPM